MVVLLYFAIRVLMGKETFNRDGVLRVGWWLRVIRVGRDKVLEGVSLLLLGTHWLGVVFQLWDLQKGSSRSRPSSRPCCLPGGWGWGRIVVEKGPALGPNVGSNPACHSQVEWPQWVTWSSEFQFPNAQIGITALTSQGHYKNWYVDKRTRSRL